MICPVKYLCIDQGFDTEFFFPSISTSTYDSKVNVKLSTLFYKKNYIRRISFLEE